MPNDLDIATIDRVLKYFQNGTRSMVVTKKRRKKNPYVISESEIQGTGTRIGVGMTRMEAMIDFAWKWCDEPVGESAPNERSHL